MSSMHPARRWCGSRDVTIRCGSRSVRKTARFPCTRRYRHARSPVRGSALPASGRESRRKAKLYEVPFAASTSYARFLPGHRAGLPALAPVVGTQGWDSGATEDGLVVRVSPSSGEVREMARGGGREGSTRRRVWASPGCARGPGRSALFGNQQPGWGRMEPTPMSTCSYALTRELRCLTRRVDMLHIQSECGINGDVRDPFPNGGGV